MTPTPAERPTPTPHDPDTAPPDLVALEDAAHQAIEDGNLALAELAYVKLTEAHPTGTAFACVYEVAAARNNYALAQRALEALIELEPNNAQAHAHLAHLRHLIGDTTGRAGTLAPGLVYRTQQRGVCRSPSDLCLRNTGPFTRRHWFAEQSGRAGYRRQPNGRHR